MRISCTAEIHTEGAFPREKMRSKAPREPLGGESSPRRAVALTRWGGVGGWRRIKPAARELSKQDVRANRAAARAGREGERGSKRMSTWGLQR